LSFSRSLLIHPNLAILVTVQAIEKATKSFSFATQQNYLQ